MLYYTFNIFFAGILIALAILHFFVYIREKNEISNLSYSLHNLAILSNIITSSIYFKIISVINFKIYIIFLSITVNFIAASFAFFVFTIFDLKKIFKPVVIYNLSVLSGSILLLITYIANNNVLFGTLPMLLCASYAAFLGILSGIIIIKTKQHKKNKFNKIIFIGIIVMLASYFIFGILKAFFVFLPIRAYVFIPLFIIIFFFEYAFLDQLNTLYNNLEKEVRERTKTIKLLEEKRRVFFINFAHEIRTPLTLISNCFERSFQGIKKLSKEYKLGPVINDMSIVGNNIIRIRDDIINYLDAEKIERGEHIYEHNRVVNFSKLLNEKVSLFQKGKSDKNVILSSDIDDDIYIKIDPFALLRIINNLINNAIKYNRENGYINISLKGSGSKIEFVVQDSGIGIDKREISLLFQPFSQLSKEKKQNKGMGLGLAIVKQILNDLNADIKVKSILDKGSIFRVIFNRYIPEEADIIQENLGYSKESFISFPSHSKNDLLENITFNKRKQTLLLIEDNLEMILFLQESLSNRYNFYYATDGKKGLEKLEDIPKPDIIISDIMMDGMNGYEFYEAIKKHNFYNDVPFLFLTAKSDLDEKIKGLSKGAIDYIIKPFVLNELLAKIESIMKINRFKERFIIESIHEAAKKKFELIKKSEINYDHIKEVYNLTDRDIEICKLIKERLSNKEIGVRLNKAESTIKNSIRIIFEKLDVNKREQIIDIFSN